MEENISPRQIPLNNIDIQRNTMKFFETNSCLNKDNFQDYIKQVGLNNFWKNNDERTIVWDYINKSKEKNELTMQEAIEGITSFLCLGMISDASTQHDSNKEVNPLHPKHVYLKSELEKHDKDTLIQFKRLIIVLGLKNKDMISSKEIKQMIGKYTFFTINHELIIQFIKLCSANLPQIQGIELSRYMLDRDTLNQIMGIIDGLCLKDNKKKLNHTINHNDLIEEITAQQQEINTLGIMLSNILNRTEINEDIKDSLNIINELQAINKSSQQNMASLQLLKDITFQKDEKFKRDSMMIESSITSLHDDIKFLLSKNSMHNDIFAKLDEYIQTIKNYVNNPITITNTNAEDTKPNNSIIKESIIHTTNPKTKIHSDQRHSSSNTKKNLMSSTFNIQLDQIKCPRKTYQDIDKRKLFQSNIFQETPQEEMLPNQNDELTNSSFDVSYGYQDHISDKSLFDMSLFNNDKSKFIVPSVISRTQSMTTGTVNKLQTPIESNTLQNNINSLLKLRRIPSNQSNNLSQIDRDSNYNYCNNNLFSSISNFSGIGNDNINDFNNYMTTTNTNMNIPTMTTTASVNNNNNIQNDNDNYATYEDDLIPSKYKQSQIINVTKSINIININNDAMKVSSNNNNSMKKSDFMFNNNNTNNNNSIRNSDFIPNNNPSIRNESFSLHSSKMKSCEISSFLSEQSFSQVSYDFLCLKNKKDIQNIINDKCSFDIFSDYVYYTQKASRIKLTLIITTNSIYLLSNEEKDKNSNRIKFTYSLKKLQSISITSKSSNLIIFHFNPEETQDDLLIEIFKRRALLKYLRNLCRFKGTEKIQIDISDTIKYRKDRKDTTLSLSVNDVSSKLFLITANFGNAIKVGYLLLLVEKLFSKSYQEKLVALTNIGMVYYDSMTDQSCIIPITGSEVNIGKPGNHMYCLQIYTMKGEKISFWSKYEEDIQLWYEECMLLQKTYEQKLLDDSINA